MCLRQISRATNKSHEHHEADDGNVNTGGTASRDGERGVALLSHVLSRVRDDKGDARPTSAVALATTQHTTRREVTSGGRRRAERWADGGRAGLHARARAVLVNARGRLEKQSAVCRPRCGFSRRLSPEGRVTLLFTVAVDVQRMWD